MPELYVTYTLLKIMYLHDGVGGVPYMSLVTADTPRAAPVFCIGLCRLIVFKPVLGLDPDDWLACCSERGSWTRSLCFCVVWTCDEVGVSTGCESNYNMSATCNDKSVSSCTVPFVHNGVDKTCFK
jgi:hypothetical protein